VSETFAEQLTAVATLGLAVFALVTAILAYLAWRKQSREVGDQAEMLRVQAEQLAEDRKVNAEQIRVLGLQAGALEQAAADRECEVLNRRRDQATRVFVKNLWADAATNPNPSIYPPRENIDVAVQTVTAHVTNTSLQPVYEVSVTWPFPTGRKNRPDPLFVLMPGEQRDFSHDLPSDWLALDERPMWDIDVAFRDRDQVWWHQSQRQARGTRKPPRKEGLNGQQPVNRKTVIGPHPNECGPVTQRDSARYRPRDRSVVGCDPRATSWTPLEAIGWALTPPAEPSPRASKPGRPITGPRCI
jgi:hypothetical protein